MVRHGGIQDDCCSLPVICNEFCNLSVGAAAINKVGLCSIVV